MAALAPWYDSASGLWGSAWASANLLETTVDYARETGDPSYLAQIESTFAAGEGAGFLSDDYEEEGAWALAWARAFELTHQDKHLEMAKTIFRDLTNGWSDVCGGGVHWHKTGDKKRALANELFLAVAARLHLLSPGDAGAGSYLDWAQREWQWFQAHDLVNADLQVVDAVDPKDCRASGPIDVAAQGVVLGALVDLAASTDDPVPLNRANALAEANMMACADEDGVLSDPSSCKAGNCLQSKGVFMRNLARLYRARPLAEFQAFALRQSDALWDHRNGDDQFGAVWNHTLDRADAARQGSALDALVASVSVANLNLALGALTTGSRPCSAQEDASNATDGSSRWDSKWCSGGSGGQTLAVDLERPRSIVGFRLRHAGAGGEPSAWNTSDFDIETSSDGKRWRSAVSVTGNTADITTHPIVRVNARYARVRVVRAQTDPNFVAARIYEFEIFGPGL